VFDTYLPFCNCLGSSHFSFPRTDSVRWCFHSRLRGGGLGLSRSWYGIIIHTHARVWEQPSHLTASSLEWLEVGR